MTPPKTFPPVVARSLPEANQSLIGLSDTAAVISIGEPDSELPYAFRHDHPLYHRLEFHDVLNEGQTRGHGDVLLTPPRPEHIAQLIAWAPRLRRDATFVYVHCNAGISRSTATAFILRCAWMGPDSEQAAMDAVVADRPQALPNRVMVSFADQQLHRQGRMLDAVRAHYSRAGIRF